MVAGSPLPQPHSFSEPPTETLFTAVQLYLRANRSDPTTMATTQSDAPSPSTKPHAFNPPTVPVPAPSYSQVCTTPILPTAKFITLAGQVGQDASNGDAIPASFTAQVKIAYANVLACLKAVGATPRDIVHVRHYIVKETGDKETDGKDLMERGWEDQWIAFMKREAGGHRPPDTVVGVAALATRELLYEVEAWAIVNGIGGAE
ncbi:Endoribonuclease L-PSP/chorismate mutase-like protein [Massariosphaeria phaeospora]|uniref:Endoribonuclease L-PSP/chorismate mutase-like protein n=1 Tax=Massariosphaeria phaeospora TaxID=100035 RepID=A0A7C8I232_9PLEO|nr:Endoribonuclease L-PSP/chorismate mutase-like protein [Massariosphaeria phaeospora]